MSIRYPGPVQLPVVIPRCPLLDPGGQCYVPTEKSWMWTLALVGALFLIPESAIPGVGVLAAGRGAGLGALPAKLRKRSANRFFQMWQEGDAEPKTAARASLETLRKRQRKGEGVLYAVWAANADQARQKIRRGEASLGGEQMSLFKAGRVLKLTAEDPGKSEDRLDICLERRGWKPKRVRTLQASISEKMTPDLFTGKTGKLTGGEAQLQEDMQKCLDRMKKGLAGDTANCGVWQEVYSPHYGKVVARCLKYGPRCDPPGEPIKPIPNELRPLASRARRFLTWDRKVTPALNRDYKELYPRKRQTLSEFLQSHGFGPGERRGAVYDFIETTHRYDPGAEWVWSRAAEPEPYRKERARIKKLLKSGPLHIDAIQKKTGWKPSKVSAVLVTMDLKGEARQSAGKMFRLAGMGALGGALRTCIGYDLIKTKKNPQGVYRCSTYAPTMTAKTCLPETMPPPEPEPEPEISRSDVMAIARGLAAEANEAAKLDVPYVAREIMSRGGIAPPRKLYPGEPTPEEYMTLPLHLKNKKGLAMDEMAAEMGFEYESDLAILIHKTYPPKTKAKGPKVTRKFTAEDFEDQAYTILEEEFYEGASMGLAGAVMTCIDFYPGGRCFQFAPTCSPPGMQCATETAKFTPQKPKTRKAPKPRKPKARKAKKRKPLPYLGPKKAPPGSIIHHEGDAGSAFSVAQRVIKDKPLYIFPSNSGHTIQPTRPTKARAFLILHPDGDVEEVTLQPGDAYRGKDPWWIHRRHEWAPPRFLGRP